MCTVCGGTALNENFLSIFKTSLDRGRDYSNVFYRKGSWICNHRAVPTTEVENAEFNQPFGTDYKIVHNGTISNDKELGNPEGMIDSYILSKVLDFTNLTTLRDSLSKVIGSYALGIMKPDGNFYIACNYKPIFYCYDCDNNFYFSSYRHHLNGMENVKRLEPYTIMDSATKETIEIPREVIDAAVVIASAGLDSTAVAAYACATHKKVTLLHYNYGCLAETPELIRIKKIQESLNKTYGNCELYVMDLDLHFMAHASTLMNGEEKIAEGIAGSEYAHEWVPARNLIMMSMAVGFAEANGFSYIYLGTNLEEGGCLAGDTKIDICVNGKYETTTIQELYESYILAHNHVTIKSMLPNGTCTYSDVNDVYCTGTKPINRITFVDGTYIDSSDDHEFFTTNGWTQCNKLKVGDIVYADTTVVEDINPESYKEWQKYFTNAIQNNSLCNKTRLKKDEDYIDYHSNDIKEVTINNCVFVTGMAYHPYCTKEGLVLKSTLTDEAVHNSLTYDEWVHRIATNSYNGTESFIKQPTSKKENNVIFTGKVIDNIEHLEPVHTFDISVIGTHNYIANGVVSHNSYPDNEQQFIQDFNSCLYGAVQNGKYVEIRTPVGNLMKHEIVPFGLKYKAPFEHTWSCYRNGEKACGHCGPCFMRKTAFTRNGLVDPIEYEE